MASKETRTRLTAGQAYQVIFASVFFVLFMGAATYSLWGLITGPQAPWESLLYLGMYFFWTGMALNCRYGAASPYEVEKYG